MAIPKTIHRIWWQGEAKLPKEYAAMLRSCKDANPGYKQKVWDEKSVAKLIGDHYPELRPLFQKYKILHQKIDAAKYLILDHEGGIYVDMDVTCLKKFDEVLKLKKDETAVVSKSKVSGIIVSAVTLNMLNNGVFAAEAKSPLTRALVGSLIKSEKDNAWQKYVWPSLYLFNTTGPTYFTVVAWSEHVHASIKVAPPGTFEPCEPYDDANCDTKDAVTVHHYNKTWDTDGPLLGFLYRHTDAIAVTSAACIAAAAFVVIRK